MNENFLHRPVCGLCGSIKNHILFSIEFTNPVVWSFLESYYKGAIEKNIFLGVPYEIKKCSECGFIWQAYIFNDYWMGKLYSEFISSQESLKKKKKAGVKLFRGYAREISAIFQLIKKYPCEIDIFDFGMGWGYWCLMAKAFGCNVKGFELSRERIDFARKNGIDVISNFNNIRSHKFDFINSEQVFEHVENFTDTVKLLAGILKKNGIIRIAVPNGRNIEKIINKKRLKVGKNSIHPLEHINCFTHDTLLKLGEMADLTPINHPFLLSNRGTLKLIAKGILKKYYNDYYGTELYFKKI